MYMDDRIRPQENKINFGSACATLAIGIHACTG